MTNGYAKPFYWAAGIVLTLGSVVWSMQNDRINNVEARAAALESQLADMKLNVVLICDKLKIEGCKR